MAAFYKFVDDWTTAVFDTPQNRQRVTSTQTWSEFMEDVRFEYRKANGRITVEQAFNWVRKRWKKYSSILPQYFQWVAEDF